MKASELIKAIQECKRLYGDLEVTIYGSVLISDCLYNSKRKEFKIV